MRAAIIAVGTELLGTVRLETNSIRLARVLDRFGFEVTRKSVVRDDLDDIAAELLFAMREAEVVVVTGGIGPTEDDRTVDAVSKALSIPLREDPQILRGIEEKFSSRGLTMPDVNRKQARVFSGQRSLRNSRGTAPGFHLNVSIDRRVRHLWIFPGVPYEMEGMIEAELEPWLTSTAPARGTQHRIVKITGMTESAVEQELRAFYDRFPDEAVTVLAAAGEVHVHLVSRGSPDEGYTRLLEMEAALREIFGTRIFGLDDETLESVIGRLLAARGETLAIAESCTGGLLASRITDVSGSSAYFCGGVVSYSGDAKRSMLGVDSSTMETHGQVSEEVAREMASGVRVQFSTDYGVGITGIAGPTGGTAAKPVGTVHIAVASPSEILHKQFLLTGSRELVKHYSTQLALDMLRRAITAE